MPRYRMCSWQQLPDGAAYCFANADPNFLGQDVAEFFMPQGYKFESGGLAQGNWGQGTGGRAGRRRAQDLVALRGVLAELAREVDLVAEHVVVADLDEPAVADADAQHDLLLGVAARIRLLTHALHLDGTRHRARGL